MGSFISFCFRFLMFDFRVFFVHEMTTKNIMGIVGFRGRKWSPVATFSAVFRSLKLAYLLVNPSIPRSKSRGSSLLKVESLDPRFSADYHFLLTDFIFKHQTFPFVFLMFNFRVFFAHEMTTKNIMGIVGFRGRKWSPVVTFSAVF